MPTNRTFIDLPPTTSPSPSCLGRRQPRWPGLVLIAIVAAACSAVSGPAAVGPASAGEAAGPAAAAEQAEADGAVAIGAECQWLAPVDGPVSDPFRPPDHRYGSGNRGLEYGVGEGAPVVAVAPGQVRFAGQVAGRLYLVVDHGDDLRSTYGPLQSVGVVRGATVDAGSEVGRTGTAFHLTARRGDEYIDPAPFLAGHCGHPRLVPTRP